MESNIVSLEQARAKRYREQEVQEEAREEAITQKVIRIDAWAQGAINSVAVRSGLSDDDEIAMRLGSEQIVREYIEEQEEKNGQDDAIGQCILDATAETVARNPYFYLHLIRMYKKDRGFDVQEFLSNE